MASGDARADGAAEQKSRMLAGDLYRPDDPVLVADRRRARLLIRDFNMTGPDDVECRRSLIARLFGRIGPQVETDPPFHCDYGYNIFAGERFFMNFGCVILDCARVDIGDRVLFGPGVQIYAATHPLDPATRRAGLELARPVRIGSDVWIGGSVVICPGVSIGDGALIGAGSVVTVDVPAGMIAAGNPCRLVRPVPESPS